MAIIDNLVALYSFDTSGAPTIGSSTFIAANGVNHVGNVADFPNQSSAYYLNSPYLTLKSAATDNYTHSFWFKDLKNRSAAPFGFLMALGYNKETGGIGGYTSWDYETNYDAVIYTNDMLGAYGHANTSAALSTLNSTGYQMTQAAFNGTGWHHMMCVFDGTQMTYYINGTQVGVPVNTTGAFKLQNVGSWTDYQYCAFDEMDELSIWQRAVTASEVLQIYNAGRGNISSLFASAIVPNITGTVATPSTFDGTGSTGAIYYHWVWQVIPGGSIANTLTPYPDNQVTNPIDMTDNEGLWHFEPGGETYAQDFESTAVGSLPSGFVTSGDANWEVETGDDVSGTGNAAVSQDINDNQESIMEYTTTLAVDSVISFYWKCSTELNYDKLEFKIDGVQQAQISGTVGWTEVSFAASAGARTFTWRYFKDYAVSTGDDHGKVDQIVIREATSLEDSSGNSQTATNSGAILTTDSRIGVGAYAVTSTTSVGFGLASAYLAPGDSFTVAFWHKSTTATRSNYDPVFGWSNLFTWSEGVGIYWTGTTSLRCFVGAYSGIGDFVDVTVSTPTDWNHYALKYDGVNITVYLNGVLVGQTAKTGVLTGLAQTVQIGELGNHKGCIGVFDELAIWSRALSDSEISDAYFLQNLPNAGIGTTNTFTPDVNGTYTIQLDVGGGSTVNADAVISAPAAATGGETFQGLNVQGLDFQGNLNPKIQGS